MSPDGDVRTGRRLRMVGGYELFSPLGSGGMGTVFKAREIKSGRIVALKLLPPSAARNPDLVSRFDHEARIACSLAHPNIVEGIASGSVNNLHFYAMELVVGESVADLIARKGRLGNDQTLKIMWDVAQGLFGAHQAGLIHRDVKPHNLMIGNDGVVKLCDLGLARSPEDRELAEATTPIGTPFYMSPEQVSCDRPIDARTDIYSLGATAYHMVTGEPPFQAETRAKVMAMHVTAALTPVRERFPGTDARLAAVIEKCLRKAPEERYPTMEALAADLHAIQTGKMPLPAAPSAPPPAPPVAAPAPKPAATTKPAVTTPKPAARPPSRRIAPRRVESTPAAWATILSRVAAAVVVLGIVGAVGAGLWAFAVRGQRGPGGGQAGGTLDESDDAPMRVEAMRALDELTRRAESSAAAGDFDAALAAFDGLPPDAVDAVRRECAVRRTALEKRAEDAVGGLLAAAEAACRAEDFARALAILDDPAAPTYRDSRERTGQLRARVVEAQAAADARERTRAEEAAEAQARTVAARERLATVIREFARSLAAVGPHGAEKVVSEALAAGNDAIRKAELGGLLAVAEHVARLRKAETAILDRLPASHAPVTLALKSGETVTGTITSVRTRGREPLFIMDIVANGKHRTRACEAGELDPAARTALLCPGEPRSPDECVARVAVAIAWGDAATARALLDGVRGHLLHAYYAAELAKLEAAAR